MSILLLSKTPHQKLSSLFLFKIPLPSACRSKTGQGVWENCKRYLRWNVSSQISVSKRKSRLISLVGSLTGISVSASTVFKYAFCEYKPQKTRLIGSETSSNGKEPPFPWSDFLALIWQDIWILLAAVISAFAVAIVNIQIPLILGDVVNVVSKYTHETINNFTEDIKAPAFKLIQMYALQSVLTFAYISFISVVGERFAARLRKSLFQSIITQDIAFFDTHKTGEIVNRMTADVQEFKSSFKLCISQGLRSVTQTAGCVVSLLLISPFMTLAMVVTLPLIIGVGTLLGTFLRKMSRAAQAQLATATAVADEAVGNVRTVRAFAMEDKEMELFNDEVEKSAKLNEQLGLGIAGFQALSNLALNGIVLGTLYIGGTMMAGQQIKAGDLMSFMVATQTIQRSLSQISLLFGQAVRGLSSGARVFEYLHLTADMPMKGGKTIPFHSMHGRIVFDGVGFTYPSRPNQKILKDFNLELKEGQMVALVGLSGGGKSTVAGLLERFYDVTEGSIRIDGTDLKDLDPTWLRGKAIGYINQEPVLFATSVKENIRYGRPDATDVEVVEAAAQANADAFIRSFPDGYDTVLGERGVTVSGGQKQRIAIARALIKNPAILVLDEATSALDAESERVVQDALDNVVKGRTVLVIAHRLSTVKNADLIAVVSKGQIVEKGTHDELKRKKGYYWELIRKQESEEGVVESSNPFWNFINRLFNRTKL